MVARGGTTFFTRVVVRDEAGTVVATGQGTHRWRTGSEREEGVPVTPAGAGGERLIRRPARAPSTPRRARP